MKKIVDTHSSREPRKLTEHTRHPLTSQKLADESVGVCELPIKGLSRRAGARRSQERFRMRSRVRHIPDTHSRHNQVFHDDVTEISVKLD